MVESKECYAWLGPRNGYATLLWHRDAKPASDYDWIGLYSSQAQGRDDYLTWQWAEDEYYKSKYIIRNNLSVRYYRWENSSYQEKMRTSDLNLESEVNVSGEREINPGCWVTCSSGGYATINWKKRIPFDTYDWIGLYEDVNKSNSDYITYQWAESDTSYITSHSFESGIHARYIRKVNGVYIALRRSKPIASGYIDLAHTYRSTTVAGRNLVVSSRLFDILVDQMKKAINQQPSVFAVGIWPLSGDNLVYKNLSYQEIKVIYSELDPSQYYDVLMIYYDTYKVAIQIADESERNAKRHAFWQISLMRKFSENFAKKLGDAHEVGRPGTQEDNRVDDLNNKAALSFAAAHPELDPLAATNYMWNNRMLESYRYNVAPAHTKDEL